MRLLFAWLGRRLDRVTSYPMDARSCGNARNSLIDGMWFNIVTGFVQPFAGIMVLLMGGGAVAVGWAISLPALVALLSQLPAAWLVSRRRHRLPTVIVYAFWQRILYLPLALLPLLPIPASLKVLTFVLLLAAINFPGTVSGTAWTALMAELFPRQLRGRIFGDRTAYTTGVTLISSLVGGLLMARLPYPVNLSVLLGVTLIGQMLSLHYLTKLQEEPREVRAEPPAAIAADGARQPLVLRAWAQLREWWHARGHRTAPHTGAPRFQAFVGSNLVFQLGMAFPQAIWPIYFIHILQLSTTWVGAFATVSALFAMLSARSWGRASERRGPLWVLALSATGFLFWPIAYLFAKTGWACLTINVFGGVATAGVQLATFNALLEVSPEERRPTAVAIFNLMIGAANFIGPLAGTLTFSHFGLAATLLTASLLRLIGALWLWRLALPGRLAAPLVPVEG